MVRRVRIREPLILWSGYGTSWTTIPVAVVREFAADKMPDDVPENLNPGRPRAGF
jgi:hypothetical protein